MHLTVPEPLVGVSNGTLMGVDHGADTITYHWRHEYPVSTYLVSVAATYTF